MSALRSLSDNMLLKVFSLVLALFLYLFVSLESATPVDVELRLQYRTADDITLTGEPPEVVHATLQGPWAAFFTYDKEELRTVVIDVSDAGPGTLRHRIDINDITPPAGMRVVAVRPSEVEIQLDRRVERQIAVQPDITGRPAFGYEINDIRVDPARVWVSGPMATMQTLEFVYTRPITVEGREDNVDVEAELRPPPAPLRLRDRRVRVMLDIGEELVTRTFDEVPVRTEGIPAPVRTRPERVAIKLRGPRRVLDNLTPDQLHAFVELDNGNIEERQELPVKLRDLPEGTQWVGLAPRVEVLLQDSSNSKNRRR